MKLMIREVYMELVKSHYKKYQLKNIDFITKHDSLEDTENYYDKNSVKYEMYKSLLEIEEKIKSEGIIRLCKECKNEFIIISYSCLILSPIIPAVIRLRYKYHFNKEQTIFLKSKCTSYLEPRSIHDVVFNDIYTLIYENGYEIFCGELKIDDGGYKIETE